MVLKIKMHAGVASPKAPVYMSGGMEPTNKD